MKKIDIKDYDYIKKKKNERGEGKTGKDRGHGMNPLLKKK